MTCPSATFCIAVDSRGRIVTSADPTGGAVAWTYTNIDGTNHLFAVSCATAMFCVATDDHGDVVTSKHPTGGAAKWKIDQVDPGRWLVAVSCPSTELCLATDNHYEWLSLHLSLPQGVTLNRSLWRLPTWETLSHGREAPGKEVSGTLTTPLMTTIASARA